MSNIHEVTFEEGQTFVTASRLWAGDYGQILVIHGPTLPNYYEVHFASTKSDTPQVQVGTPNGVLIPNKFLQKPGYIYAWTFLHTGNNDGETKYQIKFPVEEKGIPVDQETPAEKTSVQEAIEALNEETGKAEAAAERVEESANNAVQAKDDAEAWAVGERNGVPVDENDPSYHNNAKWYAEQQGGGHAHDVVWVTYGETTNEEIEAAYQAKKVVACRYDGSIYFLFRRGSSETAHRFYSPVSGYLYGVACIDNSWSHGFNIVGSYSKPYPGIPKNDLALDVQSSLDAADTALQLETDPTVPEWAKAPNKPTYTATEVGALPESTQIPVKLSDLQNDSGFVNAAGAAAAAPIQSVNGQTGNVTIQAATNTQVQNAVDNYLGIHPMVFGTFSNAAKDALLTLLKRVAYVDGNGQSYLDALEAELVGVDLVAITAVYTQSGTVYTTDTLNSLKSDLVVMAVYDDNSTAVIPSTDYTLSGSLTAGTSTITAIYYGKTTTFNVTVTAVAGVFTVVNNLTGCTSSNAATTVNENNSYTATITADSDHSLTGATVSIIMGGIDVTSSAYSNGTISIASVIGNIVITITAVDITVSSISAVFTQGQNVVYTNDTLDSLKQYLVVTAAYSDSSTAIVASSAYTLSGTLEVGTSTITVNYGGKTDTFTVVVSEHWSYSIADFIKVVGPLGNNTGATCGMCLNNNDTANNGYRRSFVMSEGVTSIALCKVTNNAITDQTSDYYPVKIPAGATSFDVSITPNTQYVQILSRQLNDGVYSSLSSSGWSGYTQGGGTKTLAEDAPDNAYIFISTKYDNAGASYPTEPTGIDIVFHDGGEH